MNQARISLFLALVLTVSSAQGVSAPAETNAEHLAATPRHARVTQIITYFLSNYHYRKVPLDDALSGEIVAKYIEGLDPNRSYFLQSDIDQFAKYKTTLDDELKSSHLEAAFAIFSVFVKRLDERVNFAKSQLSSPLRFDIDEEFVLDRSKEAWLNSREELDELWRKRVKNDYLSLRLAGQDNDKILANLRRRYDSLVRHTHQLNADDVFQYFINAYTTSVEPHTSYFSPRTSEDFRIRMSLSLEGIGAVLQNDNEYTTVQQIIPGSPADKSNKLHAEDRITGIGEGEAGTMVEVIGWRLENVVDLIRGPKGTQVRLQILPKENGLDGPTKVIALTRDTIKLEEQAAKSSVLEVAMGDKPQKAKIGIIKLPAFYMDFAARARGDSNYRSTTRDVRQLIRELSQKGVEGIVMDLRGNGGGSLAEATELTGLFLKSGPIVQVKDASGHIEIDEDPDPGVAYAGPLAVLVDRQSASASEIFAGAIQDYHRGIIIGEPTFGKGTVQNLVDLNRIDDSKENDLGQLKATIAQFFRISGSSTQHRGVTPDILYPTSLRSTDQGERALEHALPWAEVKPANYSQTRTPVLAVDSARQKYERRTQTSEAFKVLLSQAQAEHEAQLKNRVSLLDSKRRSERDAADKLQKERTRQFRIAMGLKPEAPADTKNKQDKEKDDTAGDILLLESAHILHDAIDFAPVANALKTKDKELISDPGIVHR